MQIICVVIIQSFPTFVTSHLNANIPLSTQFLCSLTVVLYFVNVEIPHKNSQSLSLWHILIFAFYKADEKV